MPTEIDGEWIAHACKYCEEVTRVKRIDINVFVLNGPEPYCRYCRYVYGKDFGYTTEGKLAFTHAECAQLELASAKRHGDYRRSPIQYRSQADSEHEPPTPAPWDGQ